MALAGGSGGSTLHSVTENQKRWVVFGIALSKVVVSQIRPFVETEIQREYGNLQTGHGIHTQSTSGRLKHWPTWLKYENINGNDTIPKLAGGRYDYSKFDCQVMSHVDFAKLYVENHMAKFNAFDEHCDASAILILLGKVPVFSVDVQSAAGAVREARNAWAHCVFGEWDPVNYQQKFDAMGKLVNKLGLPGSLTNDLLKELKDWETKGTILCSNATMDPDLLKLVQQHVHDLMTDVEKLSFEVQENRERVSLTLEELEKRLDRTQLEQGTITQDLSQKFECVEQRVSQLENQEASSLKSSADGMSRQCHSTVSAEISMFDADITFFSEWHDPDTRQWFFEDFNAWFLDPGDSRAYVLLGDPGVGKSVIAGALAQRMRDTRQLGAAYFCRHNDGTRNDPRYLLGTVAHQLCACDDKYKEIVGGEDGVKMLLGNSKLGVKELFTKLLHEPLSKTSRPRHQKVLVIIDALDETEYESREAFLDLIKHRFPLLPEWIVFFITSRPEDSVQSRLKRYNRCIKICAGNSDQQSFYKQHEHDIQNFLKKRIDFSCASISVDDVSQKCDGLFLYAYYIAEELKDALDSDKKISNLNHLFPGDIEEFFLQNVRRVYDQVGENVFKKLFGCAIVAPSPLPVSAISFILNKENSNHDKQQVIDAISQFLVLRTPDQTLTFLHNLVPAWLTNDTKAPRKLFICKKMAVGYLREVVVEILSSIVQESPSPCTFVDVKLEDYVIRIAVRFLCHFGGKDWLELVFICLTNYRFLERRLLFGKIEIYHLLHDLKLFSGCLDVGDEKKQDLLQEIAQVLSSNAFVLSECPHLLHSCLRKPSSAVQETLLLSKLPVPWLECTGIFTLPDPAIAYMNCFATSSDKMEVVGARGRSLLFFDVFGAQSVDGPFEISEQIIDNISHLEYSPDNKFIFFGRLDKWFSVERKCVEDFLQFNLSTAVYQWGFFTRDGESIVVKRNMGDILCQWSKNSCLCNFLALWALKESEESRDDVMSSNAELVVEGPIECLLKCLPFKTNLTEPHVKAKFLPGGCGFCCEFCSLTVKGYQEVSLTAVREKIMTIYPSIFQMQIWDIKTGRPLMERVFSREVQLEPFFHICHVSYFVNRGAMEIACSEFSVCNIAKITALRYLEGNSSLKLEWELPVELKAAGILDLNAKLTVKLEEILEELLKRDMVLGLTEELKRKVNLKIESALRRIKELEDVTIEHEIGSQVKKKREMENEFLRLLQRWQELKSNEKRDLMRRELESYLKLRDLEKEKEPERKLENELKSKLEQVRELELITRMRLERTREFQLKQKLEDELFLLLQWEWMLDLEAVFIREQMVHLEENLGSEMNHLETKLRGELELILAREQVMEHELAGNLELKGGLKTNGDQNIDPTESKLTQELELPVEGVLELQNQLACIEELKRMLERHQGRKLDQGEMMLKQVCRWERHLHKEGVETVQLLNKLVMEDSVAGIEELEDGILEQELGFPETWLQQEFYKLRFELCNEVTSEDWGWMMTARDELMRLLIREEVLNFLLAYTKLEFKPIEPMWPISGCNHGKFALDRKRELENELETLIKRKQERMHEMEMELNQEGYREVKSAQCWTAWLENKLKLKGRENLMLKENRWLRLNLFTRKLRNQLEQQLEQELYAVRQTSYTLQTSYTFRRRYSEKMFKSRVWEPYLRLMEKETMKIHPDLVKEFQHGSIKFKDYTNFPEGLHDVESVVNEDILSFLSPRGNWVLEVDGFRNKHILRKRNRELSCYQETPQRDIGKVLRFSFTNDDSYLVYVTNDGSLHALSLQTNTVLTNVSSNFLLYFTEQRGCGYLFHSDTEEKAIFFSNLFSPFKFIQESPVESLEVGETIAAVFCSTNIVLSVGSFRRVSFWLTAEAKDGISFISQSPLENSDSQVKTCAFSPNGQLVAIHQGSRLTLYTCTESNHVEYVCTVFIEQFGYTISSFTFSGDNASLLFCIQALGSFARGDVWDVEEKFVSGSVKSHTLFAVECCCLSSDKQEVMLCGKYQIEIWKYGESSCNLLTTLHIEKMYHSLGLSQCIVSSDNQLLVCCIANTILVYRRNASDVNSSKKVLHGHLGKIEFCRFLKESRYFISYGIDGMVFLWDAIESKAVGFIRIPLDTVACMAVSPDAKKIVCFSSDNLMCLVKLCKLKSSSF